ncbi:MAG: TVP38/TMEM64 family protein [Cytophagales bacterium]|uniref:TVP38/TMEM64 family membrane protein n=1 Tax=Cyclobacterium amurskyense TaxID=320787 RepID=A0A0H4PE26_9BACT|nr:MULTISPECIES: TVP38/TMEM64 family protein [Cyclobacterium]AKP52489.1 SNARE associated protein [Cyclobacterium amurskyense]MBI0400212.1 TVP38/TMEM64 family protein [Cyclobacterium marinum]MBR9776906.1 TVP38/TMEM64 family protein [Cytophagales bacterium]|tara:strand:+ start:33081 stop:33770 length:690 start_codon:yes stop_codon:yes gene_type:complete
MSKRKTSKWPYIISFLFLGSLISLYFLNSSVHQFFNEAWEVLGSNDEQRISNWVNQFEFWGPLIIVAAMVVQMFMFIIPSFLLMVVTVLAYGPWLGSGIILIAIFTASSIGYGVGVNFGTPVIDRLLGEKTDKKITGFLEDYGFWAVIVTRLSPFLSNDAISIIAGMLRMGYWRFIGSTMLGILPLTAAIAILGENREEMKTGLIWLGAVSLVGFIIYVWWDKKRRNKN